MRARAVLAVLACVRARDPSLGPPPATSQQPASHQPPAQPKPVVVRRRPAACPTTGPANRGGVGARRRWRAVRFRDAATAAAGGPIYTSTYASVCVCVFRMCVCTLTHLDVRRIDKAVYGANGQQKDGRQTGGCSERSEEPSRRLGGTRGEAGIVVWSKCMRTRVMRGCTHYTCVFACVCVFACTPSGHG